MSFSPDSVEKLLIARLIINFSSVVWQHIYGESMQFAPDTVRSYDFLDESATSSLKGREYFELL